MFSSNQDRVSNSLISSKYTWSTSMVAAITLLKETKGQGNKTQGNNCSSAAPQLVSVLPPCLGSSFVSPSRNRNKCNESQFWFRIRNKSRPNFSKISLSSSAMLSIDAYTAGRRYMECAPRTKSLELFPVFRLQLTVFLGLCAPLCPGIKMIFNTELQFFEILLLLNKETESENIEWNVRPYWCFYKCYLQFQ